MYANKIRVSVTTMPLKGHILLIRIKQLILNVPYIFLEAFPFIIKSLRFLPFYFLAYEINNKTYGLVSSEFNCASP